MNLLHNYHLLFTLCDNHNCSFLLGSSWWHCVNWAHFTSACFSLLFFKFSVDPARSLVGTVCPLEHSWLRTCLYSPIHLCGICISLRSGELMCRVGHIRNVRHFARQLSVQVSPACEWLGQIEVFWWYSLN